MTSFLNPIRPFEHERVQAAETLFAESQRGSVSLYPAEGAALAELITNPSTDAALKLARLINTNGGV